MNEIGEALATLSTGLKALAEGINVISKQVNQMTGSQAQAPANNTPKRASQTSSPQKRVAKQRQRKRTVIKDTETFEINTKKTKTASENVLQLINSSNGGVNYARMVEHTGYDKKKIANILFNLKKQGKIKSVSKGVYTMA